MRGLIALGVLAMLVGAAPAGAASLVYLDAASNVWVVSSDGVTKRQLTSDATADSRYLSPSMQDDGTVVVPNQSGFTRVLNPDGTKKSGPWIKPAPATFSTALNWADAGATGSFYLAAQYSAAFGGGPDPTVSLAALDAPGTNDCSVYVCQYDLVRPRFIPGTRDYTAITDGRDPAGYDGEFVRVVKSDGTTVPWLDLTAVTPDSDFRNVDVSRTGNRVLVEVTPEGMTSSSSLVVLQAAGTPPATVTAVCGLDGFAGDARPRFSPAGTQISFSGPDGLHVASVPTAGADGTCLIANDHLVVPDARDADWSPYTLPAVAHRPCPGTTGKARQRCQAKLTYQSALRHCTALPGHGTHARRQRTACRLHAARSYQRSLKRIH